MVMILFYPRVLVKTKQIAIAGLYSMYKHGSSLTSVLAMTRPRPIDC